MLISYGNLLLSETVRMYYHVSYLALHPFAFVDSAGGLRRRRRT